MTSWINIFSRRIYNFLYKNFLFIFHLGILELPLFPLGNSKSSHNYCTPSTMDSSSIDFDSIVEGVEAKSQISTQLTKTEFVKIGTFSDNGEIYSPFPLKMPNCVSTQPENNKEQVELVMMSNMRVALRKKFRSRKVLLTELFALKSLKNIINVPHIYSYSLKHKEIFMEYIPGPTLRQIIRTNNEFLKVELKKLSRNKEFREGDIPLKASMVAELEKKHILGRIETRTITQIEDDYNTMIEKKFLYQDVRYTNIILYKEKVFWIDFEHCKYHGFVSRQFFNILAAPFNKKFSRFFIEN